MSTPSLVHSVLAVADEQALSHHEKEQIVVCKARRGDRAALKSLWDEYRRPIYRFFTRSVISREEAEDLTSDTLLAVFGNLSAFRGTSSTSPHLRSQSAQQNVMQETHDGSERADCSFNSYVFSIAHNQLRQWIRRKQVRDNRTGSVSQSRQMVCAESLEPIAAEWQAADAAADPLATVLRQEHLDSACYALADVGVRSCEQFKALLFHYACGLPHKDVASLLSTRKETINARLQEGRSTLKAHYAAQA